MVMVGYGHQGEEAVIYVAYFKNICAMGVERRDKGNTLFHIILNAIIMFLLQDLCYYYKNYTINTK